MEFSSPTSSPLHSPSITTSSGRTLVDSPKKFYKTTDSPHSMNLPTDSPPPLTLDLSGSPRAPLSPMDDEPKPLRTDESLLSRPAAGLLSSHSPSPRAGYLREKMMKKYHPYPPRPAPLELRFSARVTGRGCRPEFTPDEIKVHETQIVNGLSQMHNSTVYKAFKAMLASREAARQRLLTTTWELEEAERYMEFKEALNDENKEHLKKKEMDLQNLHDFFSERDRAELEDDTSYLQAVYDDECEIFHAVSAQADVISEHLGTRAKSDLLGSIGQTSCGVVADRGVSQNRGVRERGGEDRGRRYATKHAGATLDLDEITRVYGKKRTRAPFDLEESTDNDD